MRIHPVSEEFPWTQPINRSERIHLTSIIHAMETTIAETEGRVTDATRMQFEKGWLWEVALSRAFGEKAAIRPGEVECEGIVGSPDGVVYEGGVPVCVEEYKCTALSSAKRPSDVWRWMAQVMGYCYMLGVVWARFRVLHLSFVPEYRVWDITFTQRELDENWSALLAQKQLMSGEVE